MVVNMKKVVRSASPAAVAVLRQATALVPNRLKASDGLLPSAAHLKTSPNSDHNTGLAADLTHDPKNGIDCEVIFEELKKDERVSYLIFKGKIWSRDRRTEGNRTYSGSNPHNKHLHISIRSSHANDTSSWFDFLGIKPKAINKAKAKLSRKPKKKDIPSPKEA